MIQVIPNGIDTNIFEPKGTTYDNYVFYAGRLTIHKGYDVLVKLSKRLMEVSPEVSIKMVGIGSGRNPLRFSKNMEYLGWVTDAELISLYSRCLCTVVPSIWPEPHPLTVLESMACGSPVIGSRISGIEESVKHNETGFLIDIGEPQEMSKSICDWIETLLNDSTLRRDMGIRAREHVEKNFNKKDMVDSYYKIYREIM